MFNKKEFRVYRAGYANYCGADNNIKLISTSLLKKSNRLALLNKLLKTEPIRTQTTGLRNGCSLTGSYRAVFNSMLSSRHVYRGLGDSSTLPNYSKLS